MGSGNKFSKFGKSAKAVRKSSEKQMRTRNTSLNDDYPDSKYKIVSVKRSTSKGNRQLEKTSGVKIFDVKVKKRKKRK